MKAAKQTLLFTLFSVLLIGGLVIGCGQQPVEEASEAAAAVVEEAPALLEPQSVWEAEGIKLTAIRDAESFPGASLALPGMTAGATVPSGALNFDFTVENYELGTQTSDVAALGLANSAQGQHIHLILNNDPYSAHYENAFEKSLDDGYYVGLAFLSRSYHMSVKNPEAAVVWDFMVGDPGEHEMADLTAPHLFYSRPKGTYKGADTKKLMLDFYLANTTISPAGNRVLAVINGVEFTLTEWVPYMIEGLPLGEVEIALHLLDAYDEPVPGPFNSVTRTVTLAPADEGAV